MTTAIGLFQSVIGFILLWIFNRLARKTDQGCGDESDILEKNVSDAELCVSVRCCGDDAVPASSTACRIAQLPGSCRFEGSIPAARGVYNRILGACIKNKGLWTSFGITVYITIAGTLLSMLFSVMTAYPLSRREFLIRKQVMFGIVLTMIFNAPMIPFFDRSRAWHDEFCGRSLFPAWLGRLT